MSSKSMDELSWMSWKGWTDGDAYRRTLGDLLARVGYL